MSSFLLNVLFLTIATTEIEIWESLYLFLSGHFGPNTWKEKKKTKNGYYFSLPTSICKWVRRLLLVGETMVLLKDEKGGRREEIKLYTCVCGLILLSSPQSLHHNCLYVGVLGVFILT